MKKLAALLSLFCSIQAFANATNDPRSSYSSSAQMQQPKFQVPLQTHFDGAPDGIGFFTFGEFLYWRADEDGLAPVVKQTTFTPAPAPLFFFAELKMDEVSFAFSPGFRIGLGYHIDPRDWDLTANWTEYHTRFANPILSSPQNERLDSLWGDPGGSVGTVDLLNGAERYKLRYDTIDLVIKPSYFRYNYFSFQPRIGVQAAWILQNVILTFNGIHNIALVNTVSTMTAFNDYRGVGLLAGMNMNWHLGMGVSIFGDLSGSFAIGRFKVGQSFRIFLPNDTRAGSDLTDKVINLSPNIHIKAGLQWDRAVYYEKVFLMLRAGYEQLIWFNQNHFLALYFEDIGGGAQTINEPRRRPGNLGLSGWMFSAGLGF